MKERNEVVDQHYRKYHDRLVRSLWRVVGPDNAEDVVQEAYARALKYWSSFDADVSTFATWFSTILKNTRNDILNATRVPVGRGGLNEQAKALGRSGGAFEQARLRDIADRLGCEEPEAKKAITMVLIDGYTSYEAAEVCDLTPTNVRKVVERFRKKLCDS